MTTGNPTLPWTVINNESAEAAWKAFVERHAAQLMRVARYHAHDEDQAQDCFLSICEKLCADDCRRLRAFDPGQGVPFEGWLNAVANNLGHDWRRTEFGRPRTPRAILDLEPLAQRVYHLRYERRLDQATCLETLRNDYPDFGAAELSTAQARVHRALTGPQRWRLGFLNGSPQHRHQSLEAGRVVIPIGRRQQPQGEAEAVEQQSRLQRALAQLDDEQRLLLHLRYTEMLTLADAARLAGLTDLHMARRRIEAALARLRELMGKD